MRSSWNWDSPLEPSMQVTMPTSCTVVSLSHLTCQPHTLSLLLESQVPVLITLDVEILQFSLCRETWLPWSKQNTLWHSTPVSQPPFVSLACSNKETTCCALTTCTEVLRGTWDSASRLRQISIGAWLICPTSRKSEAPSRKTQKLSGLSLQQIPHSNAQTLPESPRFAKKKVCFSPLTTPLCPQFYR